MLMLGCKGLISLIHQPFSSNNISEISMIVVCIIQTWCDIFKTSPVSKIVLTLIIESISLHSKEFNLEVFRIFVELHNFERRLLVDALR